MADELVTPNLDKAVGSFKLSPSLQRRVNEAAQADVRIGMLARGKELRRRATARTKAVRERLRRPVGMSIGALIGGALSEPLRRDGIGRLTDNVYGQAVGLAAVGGLLQAAEEGLGIPAIGNLGVGAMGVAGWMATVKLIYDKKDERDLVAVALEATTRKGKKEREKKNGKKEE